MFLYRINYLPKFMLYRTNYIDCVLHKRHSLAFHSIIRSVFWRHAHPIRIVFFMLFCSPIFDDLNNLLLRGPVPFNCFIEQILVDLRIIFTQISKAKSICVPLRAQYAIVNARCVWGVYMTLHFFAFIIHTRLSAATAGDAARAVASFHFCWFIQIAHHELHHSI